MGEVFNFLLSIDACGEGSRILVVFRTARIVIRVLQIAVPFALIIWGSLDFFKAVIAGDEKEMKQKRKPFISRLISAIIILLLPTIVNIVMKNLAKSQNNTFATCWDRASNSNTVELQNNGDTTDNNWDADSKDKSTNNQNGQGGGR